MSPLYILSALLAQTHAAPSEPATIGFHNIQNSNPPAIALAITGMLIVFAVLTSITLFIAALPRVLRFLEPYLPEEKAHHHGLAAMAPNALKSDTPASAQATEHEAIVAAIGFALHARRGG